MQRVRRRVPRAAAQLQPRGERGRAKQHPGRVPTAGGCVGSRPHARRRHRRRERPAAPGLPPLHGPPQGTRPRTRRGHATLGCDRGEAPSYSDEKVANRDITKVWHGATENVPWTMDKSKTPRRGFTIVPLSNFVRGVLDLSIILYTKCQILTSRSQFFHRCTSPRMAGVVVHLCCMLPCPLRRTRYAAGAQGCPPPPRARTTTTQTTEPRSQTN
jgi:hypothetical protein